jgi:hypothetical protein
MGGAYCTFTFGGAESSTRTSNRTGKRAARRPLCRELPLPFQHAPHHRHQFRHVLPRRQTCSFVVCRMDWSREKAGKVVTANCSRKSGCCRESRARRLGLVVTKRDTIDTKG